ncbi:MAG: alpha/beta fold hydrolase [Bradymonadia bacterium]
MAKIDLAGLSTHIQRLGHGTPSVFFIHGLVMDNLSSWYFTVAPRVAQLTGVVLYDLRGHGRSQRPHEGYTVEHFLIDLDRLIMSHVQPGDQVHLVGNSFGGMLALAYAQREPAKVKSVVSVDGHLHTADWAEQMTQTLALTGKERDIQIAHSFQHWLGRNSERKRNRLAENARDLVEGTSLISDLRTSKPLSSDALSGLKCPILALYGSNSDVLHNGQQLKRLTPACTLEIFDGCSHSILWEATESVSERIVNWIEGF